MDMNHAASRMVSSALAAEANRQKLPTMEISRRASIPYETTRRKLSGVGPLTVDELVAISAALDLDPAAVLADASPKRPASTEVGAA